MNPDSEQTMEYRSDTPPPCAGGAREQQRLLEYLDGGLSPQARRSMAAHMAVCEACKSLAAQWAELDAGLSSHVQAHQLSSDFFSRVWLAIQSVPPSTSSAASAPCAMNDTQWPAVWARHRRRLLWTQMPSTLDQLGYAFVIVVTLCLLSRLVPRFLSAWPGLNQGASGEGLLVYALAVSLLILLGAFAFTAKRPLARLLASL